MKSSGILQAFYTRLSAQLSGVSVYTTVPQNVASEVETPFPFVHIGDIDTRPFDTDDTTGEIAVVQVHIYSRSKSQYERLGLAADVKAALNRYDLPVTGANVIDCLFDHYTEMNDPDGVTSHGILFFRVTYQDT